MIPAKNPNYKPFIKASSSKLFQAEANASDLLSKLFNKYVETGIESYIRTFSKIEIEFVKYLYYYYKKFQGNIQIPIKNLCERFKVSFRWVHVILARLNEKGILMTIQGGYGRKKTRRTFSDRALIVIKNLLGLNEIKAHDIHRNRADYCAAYSPNTIYISSKEDKLQENSISNVLENEKMDPTRWLTEMRRMLDG